MECFPPFRILPELQPTNSPVDWFEKAQNEDEEETDGEPNSTSINQSVGTTDDKNGHTTSTDTTKIQRNERILLELVGAMGLDSRRPIQYNNNHNHPEHSVAKPVHPCAVVLLYDPTNPHKYKEIHRTDSSFILARGGEYDDCNPIWTVQTQSLCLVEVPVDLQPPKEVEEINKTTSSDDETKNTLVIDVYDNNNTIGSQKRLLGRVRIPFSDVLRYSTQRASERMEFPLLVSTAAAAAAAAETKHNILDPLDPQSLLLEPSVSAVLALRFRVATEDDLVFLHKRRTNKEGKFLTTTSKPKAKGVVGDILSPMALTQLFGGNGGMVAAIVAKSVFQHRLDKNGREFAKVVPYPDPDRALSETEWIAVDEIESTAYQPSTKWVTVGCGNLGTLHVEVIGCDCLPQMDVDLSGTDAFAAVTFEDNFLQTDVIWNQLEPRWLPWTTRAFQFAIRHPASLLFVSVFDFDESPLCHHDPIGRVVLCPGNFRQGMTYTLHCPLEDDSLEHLTSTDSLPSVDASDTSSTDKTSNPVRGTIILRIRLDWFDEAVAMKLSLKPPRILFINVDNSKLHDVLCYTLKGPASLNVASIRSVKALAKEISSYKLKLCFCIDVMLEIWLWRGRTHLSEHISFWLPIHSIVLFILTVIKIECPRQTLPLFLCALSWLLLSINYHTSGHPNPWLRVPPSSETISWMLFGKRSFFSSSLDSRIRPSEGAISSIRQGELDKLKATRMSKLIQAMVAFLTKIYHIYSKTSNTSVKMTTEQQNWSFLASTLTPVHALLLLICQSMRRLRAFAIGRSIYTTTFAVHCVLLATVWFVFRLSTVWKWLTRIAVWSLLGPWMKLIDVWYFRSWYATKDELLRRIQEGTVNQYEDLPDFNALFENKIFIKMIRAGRAKAEELHKLRDMRTVLFGSYSETVPYLDNSRVPTTPLPRSTAVEHEWNFDTNYIRSIHVPGQSLSGHMIHSRLHTHAVEQGHVNQDHHHSGDDKKTR